MFKKKPIQKTSSSHPWEDKTQAITALLLTAIAIGTMIFGLGEAKSKLDNLESLQKQVAIEVKEIHQTLSKQLYTREQAEKDLAVRDRLWDARLQILESTKKSPY
jgi:hypothetical protein